MCCLALAAGFIGPRFALLVWWIFGDKVDAAFSSFFWPLLGLLFLPWTTIAYVLAWGPRVRRVGLLGLAARGARSLRRPRDVLVEGRASALCHVGSTRTPIEAPVSAGRSGSRCGSCRCRSSAAGARPAVAQAVAVGAEERPALDHLARMRNCGWAGSKLSSSLPPRGFVRHAAGLVAPGVLRRVQSLVHSQTLPPCRRGRSRSAGTTRPATWRRNPGRHAGKSPCQKLARRSRRLGLVAPHVDSPSSPPRAAPSRWASVGSATRPRRVRRRVLVGDVHDGWSSDRSNDARGPTGAPARAGHPRPPLVEVAQVDGPGGSGEHQ